MKARIRELLHAAPFRPFIYTSNDCEYRIEDLDFVLASPSPRSELLLEEPIKDRLHRLLVSLTVRIEEITDANLPA